MTESDVPTLGLGSEQRQMWTQTVMTLAYGVRERRQALGQLAWSDETPSVNHHLRPRVRGRGCGWRRGWPRRRELLC